MRTKVPFIAASSGERMFALTDRCLHFLPFSERRCWLCRIISGHVFNRANLKWSGLQTGMIRYQPDGFAHIPGLKREESPDLFFGFGVRTVGDHHFSVSKAQGLAVPNGL